MKKTVTFAASFRVKAALCCSVAVLLTACGGGADDVDSQQSLAATTASEGMDASSAMTAGAVDAGPEAPASIAQASATPDTAAQAVDSATAAPAAVAAPAPADQGLAGSAPANPAVGGSAPASNEFNLSGYQDATAASPSDTANLDATAVSSADGQQAAQLPAA